MSINLKKVISKSIFVLGTVLALAGASTGLATTARADGNADSLLKSSSSSSSNSSSSNTTSSSSASSSASSSSSDTASSSSSSDPDTASSSSSSDNSSSTITNTGYKDTLSPFLLSGAGIIIVLGATLAGAERRK